MKPAHRTEFLTLPHLRDPIAHRGHTQYPLASSLFGNGDGTDRWRKVASRAHPVPNPVEVPPQVSFELLDRLPVHPGRTTIGFDRFVGFVHQPLIDPKRLVCRIRRRHPVSSCFKGYGHLTRPLRSSPITGLSSLLRVGPPQSLASVLLPRSFGRFSVSLGIQDLVPAVPRESLRPIHALSAPVAIRPVIRCPADLSQRIEPPLVLATPTIFDVSSRVHLHSSLGYLPARINFGRFIQRSRPHLLDAAAWTGLRPTPESRSRGAHPHLSRSFTTCLSFISSLSACLCSTRSMAGLYAPLPTLRLHPRGCLRTNSGPMWLATPSS